MKILLVSTGLALGGAERQIVDLADRLVRRGHKVAIAYMVGEVEVLPHSSVELFPLKVAKSIPGGVRGGFRLSRLVRSWKPDVVHSHMVHANLLTRLVRLICPVRRLICTAHSTNEGGRAVSWAYRLTDFLADVTTNVSREAVEAFERDGAVPKGKMLTVHNGIDVRLFSNQPAMRSASRHRLYPNTARRLLLAVGRLATQKNYEGLLRTFAQFSKQHEDVDLWIAGDGPLRDPLQQQVQDAGLQERVIFLGSRSDVPDLMRAADIFVLASHFEGFGLVVAEAMASGTPVVATDSGGVAEVMAGIGFLVPVDDEPALEKALHDAFCLPLEQRAALVAAGRRRAEELDIEATVDHWLQLYKEP